MMTSTHTLEKAGRIARRFAVYYGVRPESAVLRGHLIRQVGYCLELYGRDGHGPPLLPGDERSKEIYRGLREIALEILPEEGRECCFELDEFQPSLHYPNHGGGQATVQLGIHIRHEHGFEKPIDAGETRALHEMEDKLKSLGVFRR